MITESTAMSYYHGLACSLQREGSDEPETGISILVFASNPENKGPSSKDAESHTTVSQNVMQTTGFLTS